MTDTPYDFPISALPRNGRDPDPQGQAALMLVESLIHELIADGTLSQAQAVKTVEVAMEVKEAIADETGESSGPLRESLDILRSIAATLSIDLDDRVDRP